MAEIFLLDHFLFTNRFDRIIELGTLTGGMTLIFGIHALRMGADVKTFDVRAEPKDIVWNRLKMVLPIEHHQLDVFGEDAQRLIANYMTKGRILLYCDNGKKINEFRIYAPYLKPNDVIMAHDRPKEIKISDVEETVVKYGLKQFYGLELLSYGATELCFIKE